MLAAGDRSRFQLRRLVDSTKHAPLSEGLRQAFYGWLRSGSKFGICCVAFLAFVWCALFLRLVTRSPHQQRLRATALSQLMARFLMRFLNLHCTTQLQGKAWGGVHQGLLLLPNHMSYLDVIVIAAAFPAVFVTSREIEATPVLSAVTRAAGCVFVERRHRADIIDDITQLSVLLNAGINVVLFPEGTTSPGDRLLEFKQTLLESAVRSRCRVVPLCLRYERIDGHCFGTSNRDQVAWYGPMKFFPHFWQLMARRSIDVRLFVLNEVAFRGHRSRKRLTHDVKSQIEHCFFAP